MQWLGNLISILHEKVDIEDIKKKIYDPNESEKVSDADLEAYVKDIQARIKIMVKELRVMYKQYGVDFFGFKAFDSACEYLMQSIHSGSEQAYNNLIKLESLVTAEQNHHLALIRMAVSPNGKKVIDQINSNPTDKQSFIKIFGEHNASDVINTDSTYQRIWSELHKLAEYVLIHRNRVYH